MDVIALRNLNNISVDVRCDDPLLVKVKNETRRNEIFLTDDLHLHPILLAGRKIFCGWPYFTWSAGYDWGLRDGIRRRIFTAADENTLKELVIENNISYIVIDNAIRNSENYTVNEQLMKDTFEVFMMMVMILLFTKHIRFVIVFGEDISLVYYRFIRFECY